MKVRQAMSAGVIGVQETANLFDAIETMLDANVSAVFAFNAEGALVGILSEGDLLHRTELGSAQRRSRWLDLFFSGGGAARDYAHSHGRKVADVMTKLIVSIDADADLSDAIELMTARHFKRLPVVRGGDVVGVISRSDILRALLAAQSRDPGAQSDANIRQALEAEIARNAWAAAGAVQVFVDKGVVTLEGSIGDEQVRRALIVMAENVPGVRSVRDEIAWVEPNSGLLLPGESTGVV